MVTPTGGLLNGAQAPLADGGNGVVAHLGGAAFEVSIRNDANMPFAVDAASSIGARLPARVQASLSPGAQPRLGQLRRTIWIAGEDINGAHSLAAGLAVTVPIPPFAKRVWFFRRSIATTLTITRIALAGGTGLTDIPIPVNNEGPIPLDPSDIQIQVTNTSAVAITHLRAVFDIDPVP